MHWGYIHHPKYASAPGQYIRAFDFILKDLVSLFDYVEPADKNLDTYSFRIHELLVRTCIEIETNFKAILFENGSQIKKPTIIDYYKVQASHHLSGFDVRFPLWYGAQNTRTPFSAWGTSNTSPSWYQAYNDAKHDRLQKFTNANFKNLTDAISGLVAIIAAQFGSENYFPGPVNIVASIGPNDGMDDTIADYFRIKYPANWAVNEQYDFNWQALQANADPFQNYSY